jgi:hypothetical protein
MTAAELATQRRFMAYLAKPWDDLNSLLVARFAFQPDVSEVLRLAGALAVSIKHQAEDAGLDRKLVDVASKDNRIMSDVADAHKHGTLRDSTRQNHLTVSADFECNPKDQFRYLRNVILIHHASLGELDFMRTSGAAVSYWIQTRRIAVQWVPTVREAEPVFYDDAYLYFNPRYQLEMASTQIRFFRRDTGGTLNPYDPPTVRVSIRPQREL